MNGKDFLMHFGILGMHWGRKRGVKNKSPVNEHEDYIKKNELKKKNIKEMSNVDLKALNERIQLERQFKQLSKQEMSAGKKFVTEIVTKAAQQAASKYVAQYMDKGIEQLLKKAAK